MRSILCTSITLTLPRRRAKVTLSATGTFDNFNRFALRGVAAARTESLYDTLFVTSDDEPGSYYPLIADNVRYADNFARAEISLNPRARFHDGTPVKASDVAFTFHKFMTEGVPSSASCIKGPPSEPSRRSPCASN